MDRCDLGSKLEKISQMLEMGKELISEDPILEFQKSSKDTVEKLEGIMQEGRQLRLGIVGEVKAGKSSFLNALLFDGKDILPKAPTPMTAALTRISYGETPRAKIVFYDENDWNAIDKMAKKYDDTIKRLYEEYVSSLEKANKGSKLHRPEQGSQASHPVDLETFEKGNQDKLPMECKACKELVKLAKENHLDDVKQFLEEKERIIEGDSHDEYGYLRELNDYVGSEGKYTAVVKYTEIQMCNKMLEGIEVIDTPGLNDPVLSRHRTTQQFLIECDAVFLLGYCGQFLGADDMGLITSSLPNEGINKAVLIGSKLDSAILQYPSKGKPSFKRAYFGTIKNCEDQAKANLSNCSVSQHNEKLLKQMKASLPPKCISSLAYSAALKMKKGEELEAAEKKMLENFCRRFPDFSNDSKTLFGLSNISDVKEEVFEETKKQKEQIIQDRIKNLVDSQVVKFQGALEDIFIQVRNNQSDLKKYGYEQLEAKLEQLKENLDSIRIVVKNLFEKSAIESRRIIEDLAIDVGMEMGNHLDIEVTTSTRTEHHESTSGILFWKKTYHWEEVIHTHSAEVSDVDENMRKYCLNCLQMVNSSFRNLLKIAALKDSVKAAVMGAFEQSDKEFDENKILIPLENALTRITLPSIDLSLEPYEAMLDENLGGIVSSGAVKNDEIPLLKRAQDKVLKRMSEDIMEKIREQGIAIDNNLQKQAAIFVDTIVEQLEGNQKKLEQMLQDKQASLEKLDLFLREISNAKKLLLGLGA